jgi:hypothetical protein
MRAAASKRSLVLLLALTCTAFLLSSCARTDREPVYPVHGRVLDGSSRPAVGALVVFHPVNTKESSPLKPLAYVDEKGAFTLTTYERGDGAPAGEYVVTVEWRRRIANPFAADNEGQDRLEGRFSNPKTSKLRFTIEPRRDNVLPPIQVR